jgi:hypothetical protein
MAAKPSPSPARINPQADPRFFIIEGITAQENDYIQKRAKAAVTELFRRRRVKRPAKLLSSFRMALRREGLVRIQAKIQCEAIAFEATLSKKLQARLRPNKYLKVHDLVYGVVTRAARRSGLDPRFEDIESHLDGRRVKGYVSPVAFIIQEKAVDNVIARWMKSKRGRIKTDRQVSSSAWPGTFPSPARLPALQESVWQTKWPSEQGVKRVALK